MCGGVGVHRYLCNPLGYYKVTRLEVTSRYFGSRPREPKSRVYHVLAVWLCAKCLTSLYFLYLCMKFLPHRATVISESCLKYRVPNILWSDGFCYHSLFYLRNRICFSCMFSLIFSSYLLLILRKVIADFLKADFFSSYHIRIPSVLIHQLDFSRWVSIPLPSLGIGLC